MYVVTHYPGVCASNFHLIQELLIELHELTFLFLFSIPTIIAEYMQVPKLTRVGPCHDTFQLLIQNLHVFVQHPKHDPCKPAELAGKHALGVGHRVQVDGEPCVVKKGLIPKPKASVPPFGHHPKVGRP